MNRLSSILLSATALVSSCGLPHQAVLKNQAMYKSVPNSDGSHTIKEGAFGMPTTATITDKGDYLIISTAGIPATTDIESNASPPEGWKLDNVSKWYFPETPLHL